MILATADLLRVILASSKHCNAHSYSTKGKVMASNGNIDAAQQTYSGFLGVVKWGSIACILITALVILLIS
jgi:Bacterial aa3 type cytochrome c oxidase subunit IV